MRFFSLLKRSLTFTNGFEWRLIMPKSKMYDLQQEIMALKEIRPATVSDTTLKSEDDVLSALREIDREIEGCYTVFDIYLDEILEAQQMVNST